MASTSTASNAAASASDTAQIPNIPSDAELGQILATVLGVTLALGVILLVFIRRRRKKLTEIDVPRLPKQQFDSRKFSSAPSITVTPARGRREAYIDTLLPPLPNRKVGCADPKRFSEQTASTYRNVVDFPIKSGYVKQDTFRQERAIDIDSSPKIAKKDYSSRNIQEAPASREEELLSIVQRAYHRHGKSPASSLHCESQHCHPAVVDDGGTPMPLTAGSLAAVNQRALDVLSETRVRDSWGSMPRVSKVWSGMGWSSIDRASGAHS